jgi:hypothetical protein
MLVVVDSRKYNELLRRVDGLFDYEEKADQYDTGVRDGRNETASQVKLLLSEFWTEVMR